MTRSLLLLFVLAGSAIAGPRGRPAPPPQQAKQAPPPEPPEPPLPAEGDPRKIIGILDVRVDGAPPEVGSQLQKELDAQVDSKHVFILSRARLHEMMGSSTRWTEGCIVGPCLAELRRQTRAPIVVVASLTGSSTSFGWVITLVRTDSGHVLSQRAERCDVCTVDEALHNATRAALDLFSAIPEVLPDEHPRPPEQPIEPLETEITGLHHARTTGGIAMLVGGLVVAAAGTAIYYAANHTTAGLAVAGAGAGLVVGSIVTFTF